MNLFTASAAPASGSAACQRMTATSSSGMSAIASAATASVAARRSLSGGMPAMSSSVRLVCTPACESSVTTSVRRMGGVPKAT